MIGKEVLDIFDCFIHDKQLIIRDKNNNTQFYSNTSLSFSDENFCKVFYMNTPLPENVFLYYNLLTLINDYKTSVPTKFNNSLIVLCTRNSLHDFLDDYFNLFDNHKFLSIYYPMPNTFIFDALYFYLSLNINDKFQIKETNNDFTIIRNDIFIYSFNTTDFDFIEMKKQLKISKRTNTPFNLYKNNIHSQSFTIF